MPYKVGYSPIFRLDSLKMLTLCIMFQDRRIKRVGQKIEAKSLKGASSQRAD